MFRLKISRSIIASVPSSSWIVRYGQCRRQKRRRPYRSTVVDCTSHLHMNHFVPLYFRPKERMTRVNSGRRCWRQGGTRSPHSHTSARPRHDRRHISMVTWSRRRVPRRVWSSSSLLLLLPWILTPDFHSKFRPMLECAARCHLLRADIVRNMTTDEATIDLTERYADDGRPSLPFSSRLYHLETTAYRCSLTPRGWCLWLTVNCDTLFSLRGIVRF